MERTQCQWWRSLPIAESWYVHYILSKMVCTFHFVSALKYAVAFIELSCDSLYHQNVWLRHSMYLISQWDCFRGIVTHETWVQTWILNTYPGESSHLYHWCLLHWVSRGHPISIPWGDCFPWVCVVFLCLFLKPHFSTARVGSKRETHCSVLPHHVHLLR